MKYAAVSVAAFSLLQLASAQPYQKRHAHQAAHVKKDVVSQVTNTVVAEVTAAAEVVVYVDQDGKVLSTNTIEPTAVIVSTQLAPSAVSTPAAAIIPAVVAVAPLVQPSTSSVEAAPTAAPNSASGHGFSYSPYSASGGCKSAAQVLTDIHAVVSSGAGYGSIRTYGVDCNTVPNVLAAAKANGLTVMVGIYNLAGIAGQVSNIVSAVNGDWSSVKGVTVGNELVNSGAASPSDVMAAVSTARTLLRAAGFNGHVSTVDTLVATLANPELCDGSDICSVNCHPFFDPNTSADKAGEFITSSIATLKSKLANPDQTILISETGWPHQGSANGQAVPSPQNQAAAISSIKSAFAANPEGVVLFTPFNDAWKKPAADTFYAEQFWGFIGDSPSG